MSNREMLYSVPDLRDRGWTATAINKFLPVLPDDTRANPRYCNAGAPMKFWLKERVRRVEKTKRFLAWRDGAEKRKDAAARAVATRVDKMVAQMDSAEIKITKGYTDDQIRGLAADTHGGNFEGDPGEFIWSKRTARNCIRHNLTNYEHLWSICNRGETGREAYEALRQRVDDLIDDTYPEYIETAEERDTLASRRGQR